MSYRYSHAPGIITSDLVKADGLVVLQLPACSSFYPAGKSIVLLILGHNSELTALHVDCPQIMASGVVIPGHPPIRKSNTALSIRVANLADNGTSSIL